MATNNPIPAISVERRKTFQPPFYRIDPELGSSWEKAETIRHKTAKNVGEIKR